MVNSFSGGKLRLVEPPYGSYVDQWQGPVNANFGGTDAGLSGTTTINVTTIVPSSPYVTLVFQDYDTNQTPWLNPLAGQNLRIALTGALSFNIILYIPANFPGLWLIDTSALTGNYTVTVKTTASGSVGVTPANGYMYTIFSDGTNINYADLGTVQSVSVPIATNTVNGIVTQGLLTGNCVNLDAQAKIPYQADKVIISTSDPGTTTGYQNWVWYKVNP